MSTSHGARIIPALHELSARGQEIVLAYVEMERERAWLAGLVDPFACDWWQPESAPADDLARPMVPGGSFVLDRPRGVPTVWCHGPEVLWPVGDSCIIAGPPGVGKTTLTGQLVRALVDFATDVLGYPVTAASGRVLYLAMDRPAQIARSLARHFRSDDRGVLDERLVTWKGPPPMDLARHPASCSTSPPGRRT